MTLSETSLFQQEWLWAAIAAVVAAASLALSIWSLRQSSKALRSGLPAPEVSVEVNEVDQRHFGVAELRAQRGTLRTVEVRKIEDGHKRYPSSDAKKLLKFDPPVQLVTIFFDLEVSGALNVKIASRADPRVYAWMKFPKRQPYKH